MKAKFKLSHANIIVFAVAAAILLLLFIVFAQKTPESWGEICGKITACFLFPCLIAWVTWRLSGKKAGAGTTAFNLVLILTFLGQFSPSPEQKALREQEEKLKTIKETFKEGVNQSNDPVRRAAAMDNFGKSIEKNFDETVSAATGPQKEMYQVLKDTVSKSLRITDEWSQAYAVIETPRLLDFSILKREGEFEFQIKAVQNYVAHSKAYKAYFEQMMPDLTERMKVFGDMPEAKGVLKGANQKHEEQRPILEPLLDAHIAYGETILSILTLLQEHPGDWSYEEHKMKIEQNVVRGEYNALIEALTANEAIINDLSPKILKTL